MLRIPRARRSRYRNRGYSLMELAIVLAVIGSVIGVLWVAVGQAVSYMHRQKAREAVALTVDAARSYFAGQAGVPATAYAALTSQLIGSNVVPAFLSRGTALACSNLNSLCADTPWGALNGGAVDPNGTFRVCNWPTAGGAAGCATAPAVLSPFFGVGFTGLSTGDCIALVESVSSPTGPAGLVEINVNGTSLLGGVGATIQPVADTVASTQCARNPSGSANATFVYRAAMAAF